MANHFIFFILFLCLIPSGACASGEWLISKLNSDFSNLKGDYGRFYLDSGVLLKFGGALAGGGLLANTSGDREAHEFYQDNLRSGAANTLSDVSKVPGEVFVAVPLILGVHLLSDEGPVAVWAERSLRALFLGGPLGLAVQSATGGARPKEGESKWKPFKDNNGLSGHAFVGAVPFITAAKMEDGALEKSILYAASALPALSRINDGEHYLSQAFLGWYLAYLSSSVVSGGLDAGVSFAVMPAGGDGALIEFNVRF